MPNLRKTDFERIARILRDLRDALAAIDTDPPAYQATRRATAFDSAAKSMAQALAPHSGTFNARKFLAQCGVKGIR